MSGRGYDFVDDPTGKRRRAHDDQHRHHHIDWGYVFLWIVALSALAVAIAALVVGLIAKHEASECHCDMTTFSEGIGLQGKSVAVCDTTGDSGIIGHNTGPETNEDDCDGTVIVFGEYFVPAELISANTLQACAYVGNVTDGTTYKLGIYNDDGFNTAAELLEESDIGNLTGNAWNCMPLVTPLYANQKFWLSFMSSDGTCGPTANLFYSDSLEVRGGVADNLDYPNFPDPAPQLVTFSGVYGMYVNYTSVCSSPSIVSI